MNCLQNYLKLLGLSILIIAPSLHAKELESYYQEKYCSTVDGLVEYILPDRARIDCLTETEAIEVDFAHKWAESIGQSLYYANMTGRNPAVLLIVNEKSVKYVTRFHNATMNMDIKLYTIEE